MKVVQHHQREYHSKFDRSTEALSDVIMKKAHKEFTLKDVMEAITEHYMIHKKKLKKTSLMNYCETCLRVLKKKSMIVEVAKGSYKKAADGNELEDRTPEPSEKPDITKNLNKIAKGLGGTRHRGKNRMESIHGEKLGKVYGVTIYSKPVNDLLALGDKISDSSEVQTVIKKHFQIKKGSVSQYCSAHKKFIAEHPALVKDPPENVNPSMLLNWMEENVKKGTGFDLNEFVNQTSVTKEDAEKMVARCIDKNKICRMDNTTLKRV
jgi:hypothetical protein